MKSDWLDLDYLNFRFEVIDKLDDEIRDLMDELEEDESDADSYDWDNLNLLCWSLESILKMIQAEWHFVKLANDFSDSDSRYRVQIQLYNFISNEFIPTVEDDIDIFDEDFAEEYENAMAAKIAARYVKTLKALLETYNEIYSN